MIAIRTTGLAPSLLLDKETGLSLIGWGAFLVCTALYCIVYNQLVLITPITFLDSFIWGLKEYGHWLVITPILTALLRHIYRNKKPNFVLLYTSLLISTLFIALLSRAYLDVYLNPHHNFASSAVDFLPSQAIVLGFITIIWELLLRPNRNLSKQTDSQSFPQQTDDSIVVPRLETHPFSENDSVLVIKGNGERLIKWESVDFISAAGNYMELTCAAEKYLLRVSMKQLEKELPPGCFIRIHRSYIVNIAAIDRIITQPAGNGAVALRNEHLLPLSKRYKQVLNEYKFVTHSSQ